LDGYGRRGSDIILAEIPEIVAGMIDKDVISAVSPCCPSFSPVFPTTFALPVTEVTTCLLDFGRPTLCTIMYYKLLIGLIPWSKLAIFSILGFVFFTVILGLGETGKRGYM